MGGGVTGTGGRVDVDDEPVTQPFQFQRGGTAGAKEDSWACLQRLAGDVQWTCFAANG